MRLAQPALENAWQEERLSGREVLQQRLDVQGTWTNFVECGPVVVVRADDTWRCIWQLITPDFASGYGLDLVWAACAEGRTAVIHSWAVDHVDTRSASGIPNYLQRAVAEALFLIDNLPDGVRPTKPRPLRDFRVRPDLLH